jgi:hypothetical protein
MKISIERINDIIRFPVNGNVAFLESISENGLYFRYRIRFEANISKAIHNKAVTVKVRLLKDELQQKKSDVFTNAVNPTNVIKKLLLNMAAQKDLVRSKISLILFETTADISKRIPNNKTTSIEKITTKTVKNSIVKIEESNKGNTVKPILEKNLAAFGDGLGINQKIFKEEMRRVLLSHNTDPAAFLGNKTRTIISTNKSFNGIKSKNPNGLKNINKNDRKLQLLSENLLSTTNASNSTELDKNEYISETKSTEDVYTVVDSFIEIPISAFTEPVFVLELELFDKKGISQQVIKSRVNHKEKVDEILIPIYPPTILASPIQKPGKVVFLLKQNDQNCDKVNLYKKIIPLDQINTDSNFTFIKSVEIDKNDGMQPITDLHTSTNPTIYRAVSVGKNGTFSAEFDSLVVKHNKKDVKYKGFIGSNKDTVLTLTHKILNNNITLFIDSIPIGPISIEIFRKDLTLHENTGTRLGNIIPLHLDKTQTLSYQDTSAKKGRIYEYYCRLHYKNGDKIIAKNNLVIKYDNIESNISNLSQITPSLNTQDLDVQFTITKNITLNNIDITKKVLEEQNILTEYQNEITNEKEKLQNLFFTRVLRTNKLNGEIEDFGIIDSTTFSDKKYSITKNIKPLEAGMEYEYTIMIYSIAAEVLFEKYTRDVTLNNKTYSLNPFKWLHPLTLNEGTLTNKTIVKTRHANTIFTFGKVADIQYINVDFKNILPSIVSLKSSTINENKVLLKWKINGEAKKIDHFIITLESMGSRTIVGKSHNITSTNSFQFIDVLDNNEHGALKYIVTPIYFDYSQGAEVSSNTIFI